MYIYLYFLTTHKPRANMEFLLYLYDGRNDIHLEILLSTHCYIHTHQSKNSVQPFAMSKFCGR